MLIILYAPPYNLFNYRDCGIHTLPYSDWRIEAHGSGCNECGIHWSEEEIAEHE